MDLQGKQAELKSSYDAARFQFISSELDLAITFCQIAESSEDRSKSERNDRLIGDLAHRFDV